MEEDVDAVIQEVCLIRSTSLTLPGIISSVSFSLNFSLSNHLKAVKIWTFMTNIQWTNELLSKTVCHVVFTSDHGKLIISWLRLWSYNESISVNKSECVCLQPGVAETDVDPHFKRLFIQISGNVSVICLLLKRPSHWEETYLLIDLFGQDSEISAFELQQILNKVVAQSKNVFISLWTCCSVEWQIFYTAVLKRQK